MKINEIRENLLSKIRPEKGNIGICISGGIDSTAVLEALVASGIKPTCFVARFNADGDQVNMAQEVADWFRVPLVPVDIDEFFAFLPTILASYPFPRFNVWPWWVMQRAFHEGISTIYIGEGSDELFGYPDRSYLHGWAGQLVWVYPVWETSAKQFGIKLRAPWMELEPSLEYEKALAPDLTIFKPFNKDVLREAYQGILPEFVLNRPSIPPSGGFYEMLRKEVGMEHADEMLFKNELQRRAAEAWLEWRK